MADVSAEGAKVFPLEFVWLVLVSVSTSEPDGLFNE